MKIMTILGARPQFIKAAGVSRALRRKYTECLVHTGQHFDFNMSDVFFRELNVPVPDYDLGVSGGTHAQQVGAMMIKLESVMAEENPDAVLVYGDTNSTLAGALVAAKRGVSLIHIEAGLRSLDRSMPEEVNRLVVDRLSNLLFAPTPLALNNLYAEGRKDDSYLVGDVMYDIFLKHKTTIFSNREELLERMGLKEGQYSVLTIHRQNNVDKRQNLRCILQGLTRSHDTFVFPVHPRTSRILEEVIFDNVLKEIGDRLIRIDPLGYVDFLCLASGARAIITDSGGLQKEAYMLQVPCITLRPSTEWLETLRRGWNQLVEIDVDKIKTAVHNIKPGKRTKRLYGDGHAGFKIVERISEFLSYEDINRKI